MALSSMIVSHDWQEVSVLECVLSGLRIDVDVEAEPERAWDKLAKSKIDALIVDCDGDGTQRFLHRLQTDFPSSGPVVIASGSRSQEKLEATGATFVVRKPISVEQAVHTLSAARNMILNGRLRYHRQALNLPVSIALASGKRLRGRIINLSQGGTRIRVRQPLSLKEAVTLKFALPGRKTAIKIAGQATWFENQDTGIHFLEAQDRIKRELQLWLEQQYFIASTNC